jgi:hypothetical protein
MDVESQSIARICCFDRDGICLARGAGFLVSPTHVATAAHVVGERTNGGGFRRFFRIELRFIGHPSFDKYAVSADLEDPHLITDVQVHADTTQDWALLECQISPGLPPLEIRLRPGDTVPPHTAWWSLGFPDTAQRGGKRCGGETRGIVPGGRLQLFSSEAAAGLGEVANGYSGAPIVCNNTVVGIMSSAEVDTNATWGAQGAVLDARRTRQPAAGRTGAGTLYATPIGDVIGSDYARAIPSLALWELRLPDAYQMIPAEPFRELLPYREEDAAVFFGRDHAQRDLFYRFTGDDVQPVVLLTGQAGVGKSSLINAGLVPFLRAHHVVLTARRDPQGMPATLDTLLQRAPDEPPSAAWDRVSLGAPSRRGGLIVVIDQAEETFTLQADAAGRHELEQFATIVHSIFGSAAPFARRGRLVLAYRKEWHAEFETKLGMYLRPVSYRLWPLEHDDVHAAVSGVFATLVQHQRAEVPDPGLVDDIVTATTGDRSSSLAPILQVLLTRLWRAAAPDPGEPGPPRARRLTRQLFEPLAQGVGLDDFLLRQLQKVAEQRPKLKLLIDNGLALEVLKFHTTELAASKTCTPESLTEAFGDRPELSDLVAELRSVDLLIDAPGETPCPPRAPLRLVHDSLGPVVHAEIALSGRIGQRAFRHIDAAMKAEGKELLSPDDLRVLAAGLSGMQLLTKPQVALIVRSSLANSAVDFDVWYAEAKRAGLDVAQSIHSALRSPEPRERAGAMIAVAEVQPLREDHPALRRELFAQLAREPQPEVLESVVLPVARFHPTGGELRALAMEIPDRKRTGNIFGDLARHGVDLSPLPRRLRKRFSYVAGTRHMRALGAEGAAAREQSIRDSFAFAIAWLAPMILLLSGPWLAINQGDGFTHRLDLSQHIADAMPVIAFLLVFGVAIGALVLTATIRASVVWHSRRQAWRSLLSWPVGLAFVLLVAFTMAAGKLGGWAQLEHNRPPTLSPVGWIMAIAVGCVAWLSSVGAAALLLRATLARDTRKLRYLLAAASSVGIPALVVIGLPYLVFNALSGGTACHLGLSTKSTIAAWMVSLMGIGTMHGAAVLGLLRGAAASIEVSRNRTALALTIALAIAGLALNVRLAMTIDAGNPSGFGFPMNRCPSDLDIP